MKKIISLVLTLAMLFGMMVVPARAADSPTLTINKTTGEAGKDFYVDLVLSDNDTVGMKAMNVAILYNKNILTCTYFDETEDVNGNDSAWKSFKDYCEKNKYDKKKNPDGIFQNFNIPNISYNYENAILPEGYDPDVYGVVKLGYVADTTFVNEQNGVCGFTFNGSIGQLGFDVAEGAESTETELIVLVTTYTNGAGQIISDQIKTANSKITINGTAPVLDHVTVTDTDGKIVLDSKVQNQSHKVEINGTTDYTYQAHAYSKMGTDITNSVTWTIGTVASNNGTVITSGGENAGQIVVARNAKPISAAVEAKLDNVTVDAGNFLVGRADGSESTITDIKVSRADTGSTLYVPTGSNTVTAKFEATAQNIYGERATGSVFWKVLSYSGSAVPENYGIKISNGTLTVDALAKGHTGTYTVRAYASNTSIYADISVTIAYAPSEVSSLTVDENANTTFDIPKADKTGHETEKNYSLPAVTVKDQYGRDVENPTLTWQTMGSTESSGMIHVVYPGITIENGNLVVTSEAAKPELFREGSNEYQVPIRVSCGEKYTDFTVTVTREARKAASITVSGGPTAMLLVPASGESDVTSDKAFTAVVKDQYGHTIENASVTWAAAKGGPWGSTVSGVSMTEDGCVTVSSAAAKEILDTKDVTITAVAKFGDDVYGYKNFTVARAESVAKSISITSASNTVEIPGSVSYDFNGNFNGPEKDNTVSFSVTAKDQYGADKAAPDVIWSIAPEISGVSISADGVVTVKSDAAQKIQNSQAFTVTAISKTDSNVKDEATVTVQRGTPKFSGFNLYQILADGTETKLANGMSAHILSVTATPMTVKYQAKPCDQYGNNLAENVIPAGLTYAVKMSESASTGGYDPLPGDQYTVGDQTNPGVLTIGETKPAAGDYLIQVSCSETGNIMFSRYYVKLMRKADAGLNVTKPGGGYVSDTLELAYGDVMDKLSITVDKTSGSGSVRWSSSDSSILSVTNSTGTTPTLTARKPGTATVTVTYEDSENYGSKTFTVNVSKRVLTVNAGSFKISKVYDGETTIASGFTGDFTVSNRLEKDTVNIECNSYPAYPSANVGKYTNELTLTLKGKDADNYTLKSDKVSVPYEITPATLTIASATATDRGYETGKTDVEISGVMFTNTSDTTVVPTAGEYTASGEMSNANAGTKDVTVTVTLTGQAAKNYTLTNNTCKTTVSIDKIDWAGVKTGDMKIKYGNTATLDLKTIGLPEGYEFGSIDYSKTDGYSIIGSAALNGDILSVTLVNKSGYIGKKAQVIVRGINSTNYNEYAIIVDVEMIDKSAQTIEADDVIMTYGNSAQVNVKNASALHGAVSYSVTGGSDVISVDLSGKITALKSGTATVEISAAGDSDYAAATKSITVTVAKRTLTVKAADKSAYIGEKLPELTYQVTGLVTGDELTVKPVLEVKHAADVDPMKKAGTYVITFETLPVASANYDLKTEDGTLTVRTRHSSGTTGSTGGVSIDRPENGKVTVSPANPTKGSTVTITVTPNKDQKLKSLEVIDQNGNSLPLTDLGNGKFSFVMPAGKVTVKPVFGAADAYRNPYADVQTNDWYFGAVQYVTENGLMNGTGNGFEPNLATSRAMIWTILARMSNVNTASGGEWYAVAQQWAKANGVSDGTMPNGTITREQLAAMLYRYAVSKGMVKAPVTANLSIFADASSVSTYANEAMQWAVSTGLINGMDGKLNPQGSATRAQVATMLMRFAELLK